jgi:CDP-diacylglycerol--serine O-phosphatidyltransferase
MVKLLSTADTITLINMVLGFLAIVMLFSDLKGVSFSLILLAVLGDGLDGMVARKIGTGRLGETLETLADTTSLSIAPMVFVYITYKGFLSDIILHGLFLVVLIFFLLSGVIRLASFPVMKEERYFVGLPASVGALYVIIFAFLEVDLAYVLCLIVLISAAMLSNIRFPKLGIKTNVAAVLLIASAILMGKTYGGVALFLLLISLSVYSIVGPFYVRKQG